MLSINELDTKVVVDFITSSDGNLALAAERLCTHLEVPYGTYTEYDIKARVAALDNETADGLSGKLRTLLTIKLYDLICVTTDELQEKIGNLRPSELARMHASLVSVFTTLTAPATKVTFDIDRELASLVAQFPEFSEDEIRSQLKAMDRQVKMSAIR